MVWWCCGADGVSVQGGYGLCTPSSMQVLNHGSQAVSRGAARCASQILDRGTQADTRGATHLLDCGAQAVARGAARCALHLHGRDARTDACGRSFAVLSAQVSTVGMRMRLVVPRPIPAAVASRCCRRRSQQLACVCGKIGWLVICAAAGEEQLAICAAEQSKYCSI
jgi:hypothetical protein